MRSTEITVSMLPAESIIVSECTVECARDIFAAYEIAVRPDVQAPQFAAPGDVAASIGFSGARISGTLTVVGSQAALAACHPFRPRASTSIELLDWWGEFANQLLGRIKNRLALSGVDFEAGTPKTVCADRSSPEYPQASPTCTVRLHPSEAPVGIWLEMSAPDGAVLSEPTGDPVACAAEGELLLF